MIRAFGFVMLAMTPALLSSQGLSSSSPTTSTLEVTAGGVPATMVAAHTVITLTATVKAGSTPLKAGQVRFCDATARYCKDIHLLGLAQLTAAGTAVMKFVPGPGDHRYRAEFAGTSLRSASLSESSALTVTKGGTFATTTTINSLGSNGGYTLTAGVAALRAPAAASGTVSFVDKSAGNTSLGSALLGPGSQSASWKLQKVNGIPDKTVSNGVSADFNNDGEADAAFVTYQAITVSLGDGKGGFTPVTTAGPNWTALSYLTGDFNADGNADLAVQDYSGLWIALGHGDGTFSAPVEIISFLRPTTGLVSGDFNRDGVADLAVLVPESEVIAILLGNGDGTFTKAGVNPKVPSLERQLVAGDFDGDGKTDLAVTSQYDNVTLLFGLGNGRFTVVPTTFGANEMGQVADFDGDGRDDLLLTSLFVFPAGLQIWSGNADRTFTESYTNEESGDNVAGLGIGDFNGDGVPDLLLGLDSSLPPVQVLLGDGAGSFSAGDNFAISPERYHYFSGAADYNGDGIVDFLAQGDPVGKYTSFSGLLLSTPVQTAKASISGRPPMGAGTHEIVARYAGDAEFTTSVSGPLSLAGLPASAPVATLSTLLLPFPDQEISLPSNAKTVLLTNTGTAALLLGSFTIVPADGKGASFATTNNCPASLAVGAVCKIRFRFVPGSPGAKTSTLVIADNAGNSPQAITLTGTGVEAH